MAGRRFKVVLLGEGRVGKTSIVLRYCRDEYSDSQASTLSASYLDKTVEVGGVPHGLSVWDTAGQEKFHALAALYYRDADGALLVYDITDAQSFARARHWVKELRRLGSPGTKICVVGNKCDRERSRAVDKAEAERYAASVGASHFLTSAKTGEGIHEAFVGLTSAMAGGGASAGAGGGGGGGGAKGGRRSSRRPPAGAGAAGAAAGGGGGRRSQLRVIDDTHEESKGGGCC